MKIFYTAVTLLIPLLLLFAGFLMKEHTPKQINSIIGYRTSRSMKNQKTWTFANQFCGALFIKYGIILLVVSMLLSIAYFMISMQKGNVVLTGVVILQTVLIFIPIFQTEQALKQNFDANGNRNEES